MTREQAGERWVDADVETCLAVILDVENYPAFIRGYQSVEVRKRDRRRRPAVVEFAVGGFGLTARYELAYSYAEDPARVSFEQTAGDLTREITGRYVLTPERGGTTMRFETRVEPAIRAPGLLVRKVERIILGSALGALAREVERFAAAAVAGGSG